MGLLEKVFGKKRKDTRNAKGNTEPQAEVSAGSTAVKEEQNQREAVTKGDLGVQTVVKPEDVEASEETKEMNKKDKRIPVFLLYPDDLISEMMFGKSMKQIQNTRCGYRFMLYSEVAGSVPKIEKQSQQFAIDEIHYYYKEDSPSWYSICTMKGGTVKNTPVRNWVERGDQFAMMLGAMDQVLRTPRLLRGQTYNKVALVDMEEWNDYNQLHGFDESHVYGHVFYLNDQLYKKFILVARKHDCSWRVEVNIPSETEKILPSDYVPAGQTFGSFYPINTDTCD